MFTDRSNNTLRAVATTIVPEAAGLNDREWEEALQIIVRALSKRPPAMVRQLLLFLHLIDWLPLLRFGARFTALDDARRTQFLNRLQDHRVFLLRKGVWGLRTLVLMGYYARPAARHQIGYAATAAGWSAIPPAAAAEPGP